MRPTIAVLHHPLSFFPTDLRQLVGDHADLVWVIDESCAVDGATTRLLRRLGPVVDIAGLDADDAAKQLAEHEPDGVVSFIDDHLELASALAERLELPYLSAEAAAVVVDKRRQREALRRAGVPGPNFWSAPVCLSASQAAQLARQVTYPAVLKPAEGSGSRNIHRLAGPNDLVRLVTGDAADTEHIVETYIPDDPAWDHWYASYLSVESVISAGHVSHAAITGRFPLAEPFRETGNFIPGILEPELLDPVLAMVNDAIDALGISHAVIHTEIKLTPDGPELIEVNGRLGGRPPFVLCTVSGVNLFQVVCDVAVNAPVRFDAMAECRGVGFWLMEQPPMPARRVQRIDGLNELAALPGVDFVNLNRRAGEPLDWHEGTASHIVTVRGVVADHDALAGTIATIRETLQITYD